MTRKVIFLWMMLLTFSLCGVAQQTAIHQDPEASYRKALELFNKEKYGAARQLFLEIKGQTENKTGEIHAGASLYAAICAAELFNPDAEDLILKFMESHPTHVGQRLARFHLANINYRQRNYREAKKWFSTLEARDIEPGRRDEFLFKKGYSHFMEGDEVEAQTMFARITDRESSFYSPASYYYGHIAYTKGNHTDALQRFKALTEDAAFGPVVPYYIVHIYFLEQRFDELLEVAPGLLEQATPRRVPEISRIIGEAHAERAEYELAIPYLKTYMDDAGTAASQEDHYQIGFAYFITGAFAEAIPHLERVTTEGGALAQNAYFHLGYSYVQTNQKRFARNAFREAYQMDYMEEIAQESLFKYALLSFELSYDPYNEAILSFTKYINKYPDSPRREEAYTYLVDLYLTTRNYKDALESLENTTLDTPRLREAYQRVTYFRGIELFNNGDFQNAINHFRKTQVHQENRLLLASSFYWTGEAYFRLEQYDNSRSAHQKFLASPAARSLNYFNRANYSIGYTHFKQKSYAAAIPAFRTFIRAGDEDRRLINDAVLRVADSYFINKDYRNAMAFYDRAIEMNVLDTDYAVFQKGLVFGILGNFEEKIATMNLVINDFPQSTFVDDSKYEIANSYLILNNSQKAGEYFGYVMNQHPNSTYVQSAMLKTGLIHYNNNEDELALNMFREVIRKFPATSQAQEALAAMQVIYVDLDRVEEFVQLTQDLGIADITTAQQDSLTYQAAENRYLQGDCNSAIQSFSSYLERFPEGFFAVNAQFYRSECYFRGDQLQRAYEGYRFVVESPRTKFLENALLRASGIKFQMGHFEQALGYYSQLAEHASIRANMLTARTGIMRSNYNLERHAEALDAAQAVLNIDKITTEAEQEAHLIRGLSAKQLNQHEIAIESLTKTKNLTENLRAAEAMYNLALITFKQGDYEEAEQQIFEYVSKLTAYDYWLARTFLLLADVYLEKDNAFQAKHTLQSIIDNYDGAEIRREAQNKLDFIIEMEQSMQQIRETDTLEIEFGQ